MKGFMVRSLSSWQCDYYKGLPLRSLRLGLIGKADVVEFIAIGDDSKEEGIALEGKQDFGNRYL